MIFSAMAASGAPPTLIYPRKSNQSYCYTGISSVPTHPQKKQKKRRCDYFDLSKEFVPYEKAWSWQKLIVKQRQVLIEKNEDFADTLLILQHHPVYTLGTSSSEEYLKFDIKDAPYDIYRTERGGEVTYHGPGQLVMYPIINLRYDKMDLHWYLRALEEVVIRVLSSAFSIKGSRVDGLTGSWVGSQKLAAIGIRVSRWITYHGLALNVSTDLGPFQQIVPCGIQGHQVGSVKSLLEESVSPSIEGGVGDNLHLNACELLDAAYDSLLAEFSEVFELSLHLRPVSDLDLLKEKC
ncbi:hypothetical protein C5167_042001 [Papaver somniferum]|uniref:octanoyltransferase LIP2p, chloroplastic-like n=1 Tax=Papaver somniferum TaxID=3469 RepID=UPI000E6F71C8|nr:octanoyltransferase LIP2p, chloroplastic-like [Papaver somniferum]RZC87070.1 hypothetical protein C5167_042001 [Papaver somniferum]